MTLKNEIKRGDKVTYQQELMFGKGLQTITAMVVAINGRNALLDNGREVLIF
ncbi:MAG: hypothetical protein LBN27_03625 [Prevotellaceae bacterium]|jgi:hypothetical protein|nr:hypothetical protein [Prevotellaceae bacterium]